MVKFTAMHTELANDSKSSICTIGLADFIDGNIVQKNHWLIRPKTLRFSAYNTSQHGISENTVRDKPFLCQVWDEIAPNLENKTIIAFIANHQTDCLITAFNRYKSETKEYPDFKKAKLPFFDFLCLFHLIFETYEPPSNKLDNLCNLSGINIDKKDSLSMAIGCGYLTLKVLRDLNCTNLLEAKQKLNLTLGERFTYKKLFGENECVSNYFPCLPREEENPFFEKLKWL